MYSVTKSIVKIKMFSTMQTHTSLFTFKSKNKIYNINIMNDFEKLLRFEDKKTGIVY